MKEIVFFVSNIPCRQCAIALEEELEDIEGVEMVLVDYETSKITVHSNNKNLNINILIQAIQDCGYRVKKILD